MAPGSKESGAFFMVASKSSSGVRDGGGTQVGTGIQAGSSIQGVAFGLAGFGVFPIHDALVKLLPWRASLRS